MKLTIITVNLNNAKGLQKTITSVVNQSFSDFEYIVIDGGSADGSIDVIRQYTSNIAYWVSEPDAGIYDAMNKGIKAAKGEYLVFLNSGDLFFNNTVLGRVVEAIAEHPHKDLYYGDTCVIDSVANKQWLKIEPAELSMEYFVFNTICHQAAFIKRELFTKIGFYSERLKISSDWKFFVDALFKNQCSYKKINTTISWFNEDGVSSNAIGLKKIQKERRLVLVQDHGEYLYDYYMRTYDLVTYIKHSRLIRLLKKMGFLKNLKVD